mgnify:CR=1 FL=1
MYDEYYLNRLIESLENIILFEDVIDDELECENDSEYIENGVNMVLYGYYDDGFVDDNICYDMIYGTIDDNDSKNNYTDYNNYSEYTNSINIIDSTNYNSPRCDMLPRIRKQTNTSNYITFDDVDAEQYKQAFDYIESFDNQTINNEDFEHLYIESVHNYITTKCSKLDYIMTNKQYKQIMKDINDKLKIVVNIQKDICKYNDRMMLD